MEQYDLIVLGAGSGGIAMAIRARRHGARVALLEPAALGGTCVNVGCVPKKAMWLAAELADAQAIAAEVGFPVTPAALDWNAFIARRQAYIGNIHTSYAQRFAELGIDLITQRGRFESARRLAAGKRTLEADHVLIATGARPQIAPIPGAELGIDSDGFFALRALPRRVAIIGSGYIAVELAGVLRGLGAAVDMFVRSARLLRQFDAEVVDELTAAMRANGIGLHFDHPVQRLERGDEAFTVITDAQRFGSYDRVIWAIGRVPNVEDLGLASAGVALDARGFVAADPYQNTNVPGIYAVGDIAGRLPLTPVAIAAGRHLADRLFGGMPEARLDYDNVPTVIFSHPPLATVGLSEAAARVRHGEHVRVYRAQFRPMLNALAGRSAKTFMKLVCAGADERVIGVHMLGTASDEILQGFAIAVKLGARKADFDATVAIHPTSAEELVLM